MPPSAPPLYLSLLVSAPPLAHLTQALANVTNGAGQLPDNMGQTWNSGVYGGYLMTVHVLGAWQVYQHSGDIEFLGKAYTFYKVG